MRNLTVCKIVVYLLFRRHLDKKANGVDLYGCRLIQLQGLPVLDIKAMFGKILSMYCLVCLLLDVMSPSTMIVRFSLNSMVLLQEKMGPSKTTIRQ
jgi:hypothetical protein